MSSGPYWSGGEPQAVGERFCSQLKILLLLGLVNEQDTLADG